ncbi:MAG: HD domain-containing phosphohydrolase [Rhodospirillales bacterium]
MAGQAKKTSRDDDTQSFEKLIEIGIALSAERDHHRLMERILLEAMNIYNADGGALYLCTEDDLLKFEIMRTNSLNVALGGTTGKEIPFPPLVMRDKKTGEPNHANVCTHVALSGITVNIADAYEAGDFDFSGTKKFDEGNEYRSKSFLTLALKNHEGDVIGVLQLLNALDRKTGEVIPFGAELQPLIEALSSQAAVALDNQLLLEAQRKLTDSFIELIASAIDAKSPYTGGHCQRVPELSMMLADAACRSEEPVFEDFDLNEEERYEFHIGSWLHDCGKVTTPEYVVDKSTKLETIYDRIHEVRTRFEVAKREVEIKYYKALLVGAGEPEKLKNDMEGRLAELDDDFAFIAECNLGGEFMDPEKSDRIKIIADLKWTRTLDDRLGVGHEELKRKSRAPLKDLPVEENMLADKEEHIIHRQGVDTLAANEAYGFKLDVPEHKYNRGEITNLCIPRGTLTAEERFKINEHIVQTIVMLEQLPFPKHLKRVPEYAGGHHETMIGTGYPRKLGKADMSIPARIMAVADIFEALTAADRPYKKAKTLSESIRILSFMKKDQHIDADLFDLFLKSGVYRKYAEKFLKPEQIDDVDIARYVGTGGG